MHKTTLKCYKKIVFLGKNMSHLIIYSNAVLQKFLHDGYILFK